MPKFFRFPFANSGDQTSIPDASQTSGIMSYEEGYGSQYGLDPRDDILARRLNRGRFNRLMFHITDNLKFWQTENYPEWISPVDNDNNPVPYKLGAIVVYNNQYKVSLVANNTANPLDTVSWDDAFPMPQALTHRPGDLLFRAIDGDVPGFVELDGRAIDPAWTLLAAQYGAFLPDVRDRAIYGARAGRALGDYEEGQIKVHNHVVNVDNEDLGTKNTSQDPGHTHGYVRIDGQTTKNQTDVTSGSPSHNYFTDQTDSSGIHLHQVVLGVHKHTASSENTGQSANTVDNIAMKVLIRIG